VKNAASAVLRKSKMKAEESSSPQPPADTWMALPENAKFIPVVSIFILSAFNSRKNWYESFPGCMMTAVTGKHSV
jgi:hypothetical protein